MINNLVYAINRTDADKLAAVKAEMATLGAPVIRVVDCGDYCQALEGSHRLQAAHDLGIVPVLEISAADDLIDITGFDWFEAADWQHYDDATTIRAGDAADYLQPGRGTAIHNFRDFD